MSKHIKRCPECNSINITYEEQQGEIICNDCGLLIEEKMVDTGQDAGGQFDKNDKKGRGGAPFQLKSMTRV